MTVVLGIDAAWTVKNPSGVALVEQTGESWKIIATANSYENFIKCTKGKLSPRARPAGSSPLAKSLLDASYQICGNKVDLVAIDMPLARTAITGRRCSDDAVSKKYGGRYCGTHTPSVDRPGTISDSLRLQFKEAGYELLTTVDHHISSPALAEVYPHPALLELARSARRLPYKHGKMRSYWPNSTCDERREKLYTQWQQIVELLKERIDGVSVPDRNLLVTGLDWKAAEDVLDAVVCAWVGICIYEGKATAFGDGNSAIWIPTEGV